MDTKGEIPISIRGANRVEAVTTFNRVAEERLRQSSLEFWNRARPLNMFTLSNAVLRINTQSQDGFLARVRYLQGETKQVVGEKHVSKNEKEARLTHYLSTHERQFLMEVFEKVLNPSNRLAKSDLNINDLAYCIALHALNPQTHRGYLPDEVAFRGASFQRILTYSFLELEPDELVSKTKELSGVIDLFSKLLGGKGLDEQRLHKEAYGFILGAASSAVALLAAREYSQIGDYVSPAPDWLDFYQGIDGFVWHKGRVICCVQSGTRSLGDPYKQFAASVNGETQFYTPKAVIFDDGKVFYNLQIPFQAGDKYEEAKTVAIAKTLYGERGKISKFLRGANFLVHQGILSEEGRAFFNLADFRQASLAIAGGQYPLGSFVKDIGEHIQALKLPSLKQASA